LLELLYNVNLDLSGGKCILCYLFHTRDFWIASGNYCATFSSACATFSSIIGLNTPTSCSSSVVKAKWDCLFIVCSYCCLNQFAPLTVCLFVYLFICLNQIARLFFCLSQVADGLIVCQFDFFCESGCLID